MADTQIKQHVPVFVSSTYEDLIPYREEAQRVLTQLEQIVKGMEYFGSDPRSSIEVCLSKVRECKLYIAILGMRYGTVNEELSLSYTQLEYNEAIKNNIPALIYMIDEEYPIPSKFVDKDWRSEKLEEFKNVLKKRHTVSFFTTPDDLGKKIMHDVPDALRATENISVDTSKNVIVKKQNYEVILRKFMLRPRKYQGIEIEMPMKVKTDLIGSNMKSDVIKMMGLTFGDTVGATVAIIDKNGIEIPEMRFFLYADKDNASWLEDVKTGNIITAKVRTSFCVIREIIDCEEGKLLKDSTYSGLIVVNGVKIQ